MGALFELLQPIFPVIIAVCFIGVRIFSAVKRQNEKREQAQAQSPDTEQDRQEISPVFRPWAEEDEEEDDEGEGFSAWDLPVQDTPPAPAPKPAAKPEPVPKPVSLFIPLQSAPLSQPSAPVQVSPSVQSAPSAPADPSPQAKPDNSLPIRQGRTLGGASLRRIRSLPAMQQAAVWAEILGPPKGF
jgi:hypothetical protein